MNKTLWYISKYFAPQTPTSFGGRGHSLMKEMSKLGYEIIVISSDSNNLCELPTLKEKQLVQIQYGYTLIFLKTLKYSVAKSAKRIASWFHFEWNLFRFDYSKFHKPDIVVISSLSILTIFYGLFLKLRFKSKLVFEVRDIWPLTIIEEGGFRKSNPFVVFLSLVEKLAYKKSDFIIGTMPNLQEHVKSIIKYHPPVACIPMGIDLDIESDAIPLPSDYQKSYLDDSYFNVVYAGTIGITNALEPLLQAAIEMQSIKDIRFIVIGDGALRGEYIKKYNLPNLVFAPKIPRNMVQSALEHADLLYFSTYKSKVWDYGLSLNKMIDYMKAGKPIIASYSGFPSMINEAKCGEFIPAFDTKALVETIIRFKNTSKEVREKIGFRGREWVYDNRNYAKLAQDYHKILANL